MVSGVSAPPSGDLLVEINENSIVGYVATTAAPVRVRDSYALPAEATYDINPSYDRASGYRTKSVLAIPIRSKDKIIGVLQLINKVRPNRRQPDHRPEKLAEENIIAFSENDEKLIQSFASHAAVALENEKLTADINRLFESFVQAQGEWMTEEFVPFSSPITIPGEYRGPARLILHRDNASGLPEHDKSVSIPITIE